MAHYARTAAMRLSDDYAPAVLRMEAVLNMPAFDFKLMHSGAPVVRL